MTAPPRIAHVPLVRPAFRGNAAEVARRARAGLSDLAARGGADLVAPMGGATAHPVSGEALPPGTVVDAADAERIAAELADDPPDLLLLHHVTFATGDLVAPLAAVAPRLAVWATPEGSSAGGPLPFNALCGAQMTLSLLAAPQVGRGGAPAKWLYGAPGEARFDDAFAVTVAALRGVRAAADATVLRIGGTAPGFFALEERPDALRGVRVVDAPLADLFGRVEAVPAAEAARLAARAREGHDVEVDDAALTASARIEAALRAMAEEVGADALAVRCWPELPDACSAMACAAMGTLAGDGAPAACEGDLMGALSMLTLQAVAEGPAILMDLSDLDAERDALLLWHCGNAPAAWTDPDGPRPRLTTHFNRVGVGPVRDASLRPGPASAFRWLDGGRSALIAHGAFVGASRTGYDGVRGWWTGPSWGARRLPAERFLAELLHQRVPHHLALAGGDRRAALAEACAWLGASVRPAADRPFPNALHGGAGA